MMNPVDRSSSNPIQQAIPSSQSSPIRQLFARGASLETCPCLDESCCTNLKEIAGIILEILTAPFVAIYEMVMGMFCPNFCRSSSSIACCDRCRKKSADQSSKAWSKTNAYKRR